MRLLQTRLPAAAINALADLVAVGFGIAQEAALKFKETCGVHAEAFSAAEVRHGPMALVGPGFPVLVFAQDDETRDGVESVVRLLGGAGHEMSIRLAVGERPAYQSPPDAERFGRAVPYRRSRLA